ncbi:peptidoglycan-associated lipoprotein Pal [Salipiger bermudensis]|uniref:Peptidoglycan-associated lipoprotein n=1 Tax=Salipiger bermudensis (strain DSM 26914 / JCM 13377 / KCTC 12554 / HTCC2601) TaxID=314265 RepID=Q0FL89_SALBH|nr:peptidoglycan-associated lipoprotein Pal [Salipiger bermudensis]EAU44982.1 peptidoglycan-associated lipoprotein [Salipiger bermudensis HTCC2601]MBN9676286.1 peptidoglycan-associated lipoprotein Pal [Salipiger bermudensis]MBR9890925.1 peptidoglycan-associated lipoprotein Pal [bacterium]MCA1285409.1 peptidoglycan-associated lipoprotein Pal [Salipiger bermudensis]|tara:strand:- start:122 stop:646 length:525 start_codon:yes stop_codon:yes gene_type:complete
MTYLSKALMIAAALGLAACTSGDRFGAGSGADGYGAGAGANAGIVPGSANDPQSPAYFNQTIGDRVLFLVDQSSLTPEAQATLDAQAGWLMTNSDYLAVIEGHADEQGTREYNIALGARRANATMEYLISKGVAPNRLKIISYGKERPVEICSEESCYAKNRRAVTVISMGLGS